MRHEWYLARYKDGFFIDKSPYAMSKDEAEQLKSMTADRVDGFEYKVQHRSSFKK